MQHPERTTFLNWISVSGGVCSGCLWVYQCTQGQEAWPMAGASLTGLAAPVMSQWTGHTSCAPSNPMPMAAPPRNRTRSGFLLIEIPSSLKSAKSQCLICKMGVMTTPPGLLGRTEQEKGNMQSTSQRPMYTMAAVAIAMDTCRM